METLVGSTVQLDAIPGWDAVGARCDLTGRFYVEDYDAADYSRGASSSTYTLIEEGELDGDRWFVLDAGDLEHLVKHGTLSCEGPAPCYFCRDEP